MKRIPSAPLLTTAAGLLVALATGAAHADTVVQVPLPTVLDARSVTTLTAGQLVIFTLPTDGGNLQNAFATKAVAELKGKPAANALPNDGKFPANERHPEVVLNFSNEAAATSPQTHLMLPSAKITFPVPAATYSKFYLFFNGAAGGTTIKVTLTYTDGTSIANAVIPDYYNNSLPTDPVVFDLAPNLAKWDKTTAINEADHHNINGVELLPTAGKTLTNVEVERGVEGNLVFWGATGVATSDVAGVGGSGAGGAGGSAGAGGAAAAGSAGLAGAGGVAVAGTGGQPAAMAGAPSAGAPGGGAGSAGTSATAGSFTAPSDAPDDGGCGCRLIAHAGGASRGRVAWFAFGGLALVALQRRRWRVK